MKNKGFINILIFIGVAIFLAACSRGPEETETKDFPAGKKLDMAKEVEETDLLTARKIYRDIFSNANDPEKLQIAKGKIEDLNMKILFSNIVDEDSILYEVKSGDTLGKIAKKFGTTVELIQKANDIESHIIRVGDRFKIPTVDFSVIVDKSQNTLFLKKDDEIFKTYTVSTGANNSTPVGEFTIISKMKNPVWFRRDVGAVVPADSPKNILGTRWMGLNVEGYGIHGTTEPEKLGQQITEGCIRMRNEEAEELFSIVSRGTKVTIID